MSPFQLDSVSSDADALDSHVEVVDAQVREIKAWLERIRRPPHHQGKKK